MRAVWSFWSKPFYAGRGTHWRTPLHHLLAWGLSLRLARAHYPDTVLVTDSPGKLLLVDKLGLSFTHVSTELDRLRNLDPAWWAVGKLVAYSLQDKPFVHLDTDVFLWRPLPAKITTSPVLAQFLEHPFSAYEPWVVETAFASHGLDLPAEWEWYRSSHTQHVGGINCGILGGTNVAFIRHYAQTALDVLQNPRNSVAWAATPSNEALNLVIEQFFLLACNDFHRINPAMPFGDVHIKYLFPSWDSAVNPNESARLGFTHLMSGAKTDPTVVRRLEERMQREDGGFYRHCARLTRE
jgi:hypothetical protein